MTTHNFPSLGIPRIACLLLFLFGTAASGPVASGSVPETIDDVQRKVVKLYGAGGLRNLAGYGTGFLVSAEGHIVTVWSHLLDADVVTVVLDDGRRFFGRVIGTDSRKDVAVLKIDAEDLPHFKLEESGSVGPGAPVLAFSNMFKVATGDEPVTVVHGVVSARTELAARRGRYQVPYSGPVYVLDAVTNNPGAAGGVLTTLDGTLLAMLGRELKNEDSNTWLNYAMPVSELRPSVEDIIAGRFTRQDPLTAEDETPRGAFSSIDFGIVLVPDVVYRTPAYIDAVIEETQGAEAGLKPNDLIVFANGELVHSIRSFNAVLTRLVPGDDLQLVVRRGGSLVNATFRVPRDR
jgi:serine protease Do